MCYNVTISSSIFVIVLFFMTSLTVAANGVPGRPDAKMNPETGTYIERIASTSDDWHGDYQHAKTLAPAGWTSEMAKLETQQERDFVTSELPFSTWAIYWTGLECDEENAYVLHGPGRNHNWECQSKTLNRSHFFVEYHETPPPVPISKLAILLSSGLILTFLVIRMRGIL